MKLPLAITFAIIAAAALLGWRNHRELDRLTRTYQQVRQQADSLGPGDSPSRSSPRRTRSHQPRQLDSAVLAKDLIAFTNELEARPDLPDLPSLDDREQRMLDWQRRLLALDSAAIESLIAEIQTAAGLKEDTRQDLLFLAFQAFAESHPQAALETIATFPDLLKNPDARANVASAALVRGMATGPAASIAWYRDHRDLFPGQAGTAVTERLLLGTSRINPKVAFQLIGDLGLQDPENAVRTLANSARTSAQRDATLAAFRDYIATIQEPEQRKALTWDGIHVMISSTLLNGVESGTQAIGHGRFTPEEIEAYAERVSFIMAPGEDPKWIDWLAEEIPNENVTTRVIPRLFGEWTQKDYQAAGDWLASAPEGPMKTAAAAVYAGSMAAHHPATAARWALTLPPGETRDRLLPQIHQSWAGTDPEAARAFAETAGINR